MSDTTPQNPASQFDHLNQLLRELDSTLNDQQHELLTRLFAERAVLTAMRTQQHTGDDFMPKPDRPDTPSFNNPSL